MWVKYYDILQQEFPFLIIGIILFILSCILIVLKTVKLNPEGAKTDRFIMGVFITICCFVITILVGIIQIVGFFELKDILENKQYTIVEGNVKEYVKDRTSVKFEVDSIGFKFSNNRIIDSGKYVRIYYYKGEILRLWVLDETKK